MLPTPGFLGNTSRNLLRGPGLTNVDFSVVKDTAIGALGEAGRLEFRTEFFNLLNHANFNLPARTAYSGAINATPLTLVGPVGTAGVITGAATSRQIQFAVKVIF